MKKAFLILTVVALLSTFSTSVRSQLLWRGAKTLSKGKFILMESISYADFTKKYDWVQEKWEEIEGDDSQIALNTMIGYGILPNWEAMIHVPVLMKESAGASSSGLGDVWLKTRYCILKGTKSRPFVTLVAGARFATGDKDEKPALGDGTIDFALGAMLTTHKIGFFQGHAKVGYWINTKTAKEIDLGDKLVCMLKADCIVSRKLTAFLSLSGWGVSKERDKEGNQTEYTQKSMLELVPGIVWKPVKGLSVRPKVKIPILAKGGKKYNFVPALEFWYVF